MQHPFDKILPASTASTSQNETSSDAQTRRDHLKRVVQLGVGAVVVGTAAPALALRAAFRPTLSQDAKRIIGSPEQGGNSLPMQRLLIQKAAKLLQDKNWSQASQPLDQLRRSNVDKGLQTTLDRLDKSLKDQVGGALDKADKQSKGGELVPALEVFRMASRLNPRYGMQKRAAGAIAEMEKHELYPIALQKVKKIEADKAKPKPQATSAARGEEGGRPQITTRAIGEEGGRIQPGGPRPVPRATTLAIGEEGGGR